MLKDSGFLIVVVVSGLAILMAMLLGLKTNPPLSEGFSCLHKESHPNYKGESPKNQVFPLVEKKSRKVHERFLKNETESCVLISPEESPSEVNAILSRYYSGGAYTHYIHHFDDGQMSICFLSAYED